MSIKINWERLTGGEDGAALAETIRAFIHDRFQQVALPKMIRSVKVHSFDFGTVGPELELKDVCDPLPDFYDDGDGDDDDDNSPSDDGKPHSPERISEHGRPAPRRCASEDRSRPRPQLNTEHVNLPSSRRPSVDNWNWSAHQSPTDSHPFPSRATTPGIPGGTSNLNYFHQPLSVGLTGPATPFAAVAGAHLPPGWLDSHHMGANRDDEGAIPNQNFRPALGLANASHRFESGLDKISEAGQDKSPDDVQVVMRLKYAGDIGMTLTADILLDYPMPSFVGIPLQLKVTGIVFDGIAILAYIKSKAHFCFLSPDDADALVGREPAIPATGEGSQDNFDEHGHVPDAERRVGGLFEKIKVESEIGQKTSGKQVLKNVGTVEKFVLEQVRKIFETEFVHPSFWTFLV